MMFKLSSSVKVFLLIAIFNVVAFILAVYIWSKVRSGIIKYVHSGLLTMDKNYYKRINDKLQRLGIFSSTSSGSNQRQRNHSAETSGSADPLNILTDADIERMHVTGNKLGEDEDEMFPVPSIIAHLSPRVASNDTWWYYFFYSKADTITNNEAKMYLKFIRDTFRMLFVCSIIALIVNGVVIVDYAIDGKPYFPWTYTLEDLLHSKLLTWLLYTTTWVYSFIFYVQILDFQKNVNDGKQVTVILRPQLHTIMLTGIDKNLTDPNEVYKHFDSIFPNHVIAVHIIMNYSKRMRLERKLEAAKLQLVWSAIFEKDSIDFRILNKIRNAAREMINSGRLSGDENAKFTQSSVDLPVAKRGNLIRKATSFESIFNNPSIEYDLEYISKKKRTKSGFEAQQAQSINQADSLIMENLEYYVEQIRKIKALKAELEEEKSIGPSSSTRLCFVSFADSNIVPHILKDRKILEAKPKWRIFPAPHPRDIAWKNLHLTRAVVFLRCIVVNIGLILFYVLVTYLLSSLNLLYTFKDGDFDNAGKSDLHFNVAFFIQSLLPAVVMAFINTCVHPNIILFMSKLIGFWTNTMYQKYLLYGHIFYLLTSTIFVPLAASLLAFLKIFKGSFESLSFDLGRLLVATSWRFSTIYVINATFLGSASQLLQVANLFLLYVFKKFFKSDYGIQNFDFGFWYAFHLSILTLVMLFSLFIPYLLLLGTLYFGLRYFVDQHNIAHGLWKLEHDSTGSIASSAVKSMLICISLTQFAMSGVFLNCQNILSPTLTMLLYVASIATWLVLYESNLDSIMVVVHALYSFKLAPLTDGLLNLIKVCYMHPCDSEDFTNKNSRMSSS